MNNFIHNQNWRYATKKFDSTKKIAPTDLNLLKEAIRLSVSSYGLQPYKVLIIENLDMRDKLKAASFNQSQITDASHLVVFANFIEYKPQYIDEYIFKTAETRNLNIENIKGYGEFIKRVLLNQPTNDVQNWSAKQTYIALTNLVNAAAELKIDVSPMEGFESEKVNEILNLTSQNLNAVLLAPIGYRAIDDETQYLPKIRKSNQDLFIEI